MKRSVRGIALLMALILLLAALPVQAAQTDILVEEEWDVLLLTNRERLKAGLTPVTATGFLQEACDIRAVEIEKLFEHTRPDGTSCFTVFDEVGTPSIRMAGENIAAGYTDAASVTEGWMNSSGHRANILTEGYAHMGAGYYLGGGAYRHQWVQMFFTGYGCEYTKMELSLPANLQAEKGLSVDDMGILVVLTCRSCGECYLPLMTEFCTGYDPNAEGKQNVKVSCFGLTAEFSITATEASNSTDSDGTGKFTDVSKGDWYYDAVNYAVEKGLMNGTGNNRFEPESPMTRAMLVTVLWRYAGSPEEGTNEFSDVKEGQWYTKAVAWAAKNGVVTGVGNGRFDPEGKITREQMATILYRYSNALGLDTSKGETLGSFPDGGKVSAYAADALSWAVAEGLIAGTAQGGKVYLDPQGSATRAQVATILMRYIENIIE